MAKVESLQNLLVSHATGGGSTAYGDTYFMTQPRFETGDARYSWLNRIVAVAEGRLVPSAAEYQVFALVHG